MSEEVLRKLKDHETQLDLIAKKVVEHDERLGRIEQNMASKQDHREVMDTLDVIVKLAKKKDEELTFMGERVKRIEDEVQKLRPANGLV